MQNNNHLKPNLNGNKARQSPEQSVFSARIHREFVISEIMISIITCFQGLYSQ